MAREGRGCLLSAVLIRSSYTAKEAKKKGKVGEERGSPDSCTSRFAYLFCLSNPRQKFPGARSKSLRELFIASLPIYPRELAIHRELAEQISTLRCALVQLKSQKGVALPNNK